MTLQLPTPIAGYFAAERRRDAVALSQRFTPTAVVKDEGKIQTGREAIQAWMTGAWEKYNATTEPVAVAKHDATTVVTCRVAGDFQGSPVDLHYHFVVDGDLIATLEVRL